MKKTGAGRYGALGVIALALIIVFSVMALTGCLFNKDDGVVTGISVKESSVKGYYVVGEFDITSVLIDVAYDNGDVNSINVTKSMLTTEAANSLKTAGEKNVTITYKGKTAVLSIYLVDDGSEIACVTFNGFSGQELGKKYTLAGGSVEAVAAPEVEGQRFIGWVDAQGNIVDLTKVSGSITVTAQYSVTTSEHLVRYLDYKGAELKRGTVTSGTRITSSDAPSVSLSRYPELESFGWSESFPFEVNSDITVKMVPTYKQCAVTFAYATESNPSAYTLMSEYALNVVYGTNVNTTASKVEKRLADLGYEIVTRPSQSTTITQTGLVNFIYIVKDASVQVKVYRDEGKTTEVPYDSPMKIGSQLVFPTSAATKTGYVLSAWKVTGTNGSVEVSVLDGSWTVTKELGLSVEVTPVYSSLTVQVGFIFEFKDVRLPSDNSLSYRLTLSVNDEFALGDAVYYRYIDNLLNNIAENKNDYLKLLAGQSTSNPDVVRNVRDNGSAVRELAFNNVGISGITSVVCEETTLTPGSAKEITAAGMEFTVYVSAATDGIVWEKINDEKGNAIGYRVSGLDGSVYTGDNVFIPDYYLDLPVLEIGDNALRNRNVTRLSANLTKIGTSAFDSANIYGDVVLSKLVEIGNNAFADATFDGEKIELSILGKMGTGAFANLKADGTAVNLGKELKSVPTNAFNGASGITSIAIPSTVTRIGDYAFAGTGITSISSLEGVVGVGTYALSGVAVTEINLPKATSVGSYAFINNASLETLSIGTEAGTPETGADTAFYINALDGCVNLRKVTFGAKVSAIEPDENVFKTLVNLSSIEVAAENANLYTDDDVLYMISGGKYRLIYYPNDKTGSYKANIADGASLIVDANAFAYASIAVLDFTGISEIAFENTVNTVYAVVAAAGVKDSAEATFTGAVVVSEASEAAFGYDENSGIIYKLNTTGEGENATTTAEVVSGYRRAKEITVPASLGGHTVTKVANGAFAGFENLEKLTVLATLEGWNATILDGDAKLKEFSVNGWSRSYEPAVEHFAGNGWFDSHNVIKAGGALVGYNDNAYVAGRRLTVVTAEEAAEYFTSGIPAGFFEGSHITEITLPASVKVVNENAFKGSQLTVFGAAELTFVGANAFEGCANLTEIALNFTGATAAMYDGAFKDCTALTKASVYGTVNANRVSGVTYYFLPAYTFQGCASLEEVTLEKINQFGKSNGESKAFYGCEKLEEFDFTSIIGEEIPAGAFYGSGIRYAILTSSTLTTIGQEAFMSSSLKYVQFGSTVTSVGAYAFDDCAGLTVELSYDNGGLTDANASVGERAFTEDVEFFITQALITDGTYLASKHCETKYPNISFALTTETNGMGINFSMMDITFKVFLRETDVVAPGFEGYSFAGWFLDADETNPIEFPTVITESGTIYAKYYDEKQGSVSASADVKYVYYLGATPSVSLDSGESAVWYYTINGGAQVRIESMPLIAEANRGDEIRLILNVTNENGIVYAEEYEQLGEFGYALVNYSGSNPNRISIPDVYDDGENGSAPVIVLYAGAFRDCVPEEGFVPSYVKAIMMGHGDKNIALDSFEKDTTFGSALKYVTIPAATEYIQDGAFAGSNIEELIFEEGSMLRYATQEAFLGSKWWSAQIANAANNGGFITAGRLAVKFVGTADVLLLPVGDGQTVVSGKFGFVEGTEEIAVTVKVFKEDGTEATETVNVRATKEEAGDVYRYTVNAATIGTEFEFALNTTDSENWTYVQGRHLFILNSAPSDAIAISVASVHDSEVTVPNGTLKLADGIFKDNAEIRTLVINKELEEIGAEALANSGLSSIRYGATNSEQYVSSISVIGKDAFKNTAWYMTERVILGTTFLKYNNISGAQSLTITESITKIADEAFRGAMFTSVNISSSTLKEIGAFAFKGSNIGSITLPRSVETLGRGVFADCKALVNADFALSAVKELPAETFKGASALASLVLPNSVAELGVNALSGCSSLAAITAKGITKLDVSGEKFECGLTDTAWYSAAAATEQEQDSALTLGNVLVRYIVGTESRKVYEETHEYTVEIPANVTMIAYKAFSDVGARYISEIVIPDSVKEIGDDAFIGCKSLETVQFGLGLEVIGARAFKELYTLKNAVLPEGLVKIGDSAFYGTSLTSEICDDDGVRVLDDGYTIPSTVTEIGAFAFYGVKTLTVINLGSKITKIGEGAFNTLGNGTASNFYKINWELDVNTPVNDGTNQGSNVSPAEQLASYIADNGIGGDRIFVTEAGRKIRFYAAENAVSYVQDPTRFGYSTTWDGYGWEFFNTGSLPEVKPLSSGYTLAPFNSEYIKEGDIPEPPHSTDASGKTYTFMYWVIVNGNERTPISYPYVVTSDIEIDAVFYTNETAEGEEDDNGVTFTVFMGDTLASIEGFTGAGDTLYIPNKIGDKPVTAVSIPTNDDTIKTLVLTNAANFNGMTTNIFSEFTALERIELRYAGYSSGTVDYKVVPVTLTATSGENSYEATFYAVYSNDVASGDYGTKLIAVIGNVEAATEKARSAGYDGAALLDFVFEVPEGVTEIYEEAMVNCGFETVSLPSTLTAIGDNAFGNRLARLRVARNINLVDVMQNAINSEAPIMKREAGSQVTATNYIEINGLRYRNGTYGYFYAIANVLTGYQSGVLNYTQFVLPGTVNGIDITVLASDINKGGDIKAEVITLPTNLRRINTDAFNGLNFGNVLNADEYARLTEVAGGAFSNTDFYNNNRTINGLYVGKVLVRWESASDGNCTIRTDTVAIASDAFRGSTIRSIVIPENVVSIGANAFYGCTSLETVTIPNSVTTIGNGAFRACNGLKTVNIDTVNSTLASIGDYAFSKSTSLTTLRLPYSLKSVGSNAFSSCTSLEIVSFDAYNTETQTYYDDPAYSSKLTELGDNAFVEAVKLTSIKIPQGISEIKEHTFENCVKLTTVEFHMDSRLSVIGNYAFSGCVSLGSVIDVANPDLFTVNMPDSLISVGYAAFNGCAGMWGITFGHNLDVLGDSVFVGCSNLVKVKIRRATAPSISSTTFGNIAENNYRLRVYVQGDEHQAIKDVYVAQWQNAWNDCKDYIYERGDLPTAIFKNLDGTEVQRVVADIMVNPTIGTNSKWQYESLAQTTANGGATGSRSGNVADYKNQRVRYGDIEYVLLIIDYDEVTLTMANG